MRLALVGALPLLFACSSTPPAAPLPGPPATDAGVAAVDAAAPDPQASLESKDSKHVARTLVKVSAMRGIPSTKAVPGVTLPRSALVARIKDKALREYPPEALRREGLVLQLAGFAPPTFDYLGEMMKLLDAQLEGFYEPKNGTMYLAADLEGDAAKATLAHELVHALQDQRWDLKQRSDYKPGQSDTSMALACLAEGDATSLMLDYILAPKRTALDLPQDSVRALMEGGINTPEIQSVPHIMRSSLVAPYVEGVVFVNALRNKNGWDGVNKAWDRTPTTTEQILHVEKWEAQEGAIAVSPPTAAALGEGWKLEDDDSFGELSYALMYEEWMSDTDARLAASGWGGDRSSVYTKGEEIAFAVHERYDEAPKPQKADALAERAMGKLVPALKKTFGKPMLSDASTICFERPRLGPLLFSRRDRELVFINGPAKVTKDNAWSSNATCAQAKTWADEIGRQK